MPRTILDVSRWQGRIDWDKVRTSGLVSGVMIRAMGNSKEGKPSKPYIDPYFARNYAECTRVGLPVGVYGYFKATTKAQADRELALLKLALTGKTFQLPVAVDIEDKLQVAYRTKKPTPDWAFGMWQYTSSGKIPGIAKGADLSVAYKDYAAIIQRAGLTKVKGE